MSLIPPEDPPVADWEGTVDRVASQRASILWFLGHALDETYLEDYINQMERLSARHVALLNNIEGEECLFLFGDAVRSNPQSGFVQQPWMQALYPLGNLWELYSEYGDLTLGPEEIRISRIFKAFERFVWTINARIVPGSDGSASAPMANLYGVTWSGPRIGGEYLGNDWRYVNSDYTLYMEGKASLVGHLFRAAHFLGMDSAVVARAESLEEFVLDQRTSATCWDKSNGQFYQTLIAGSGYTGGGTSDDLDADGLPDWWEVVYFTNTTAVTGNEDADRDGASNREEYTAGTHPGRESSVLRCRLRFDKSRNGVVIEWPSVLERAYGIERRNDADPVFEGWVADLVATPPMNAVTDRNVNARAMYRIRVERP